MIRLKRINRVWFVAVLAVVANGIIGTYNHFSLLRHERIVLETRIVQAGLSDILSDMKDAETGLRGFIITRDESTLKSYRDANSALPGKIRAMRETLANRPDQAERFAEVESLIATKDRILNAALNAVRQDDAVSLQVFIASREGIFVMDRIRERIATMSEIEESRFLRQTSNASRKLWWAVVTNFLGTTLALVVILLANRYVGQELRGRVRAESAVRTANDRLEATVQIRTIALTQTSQELLRSNQELEKFAYVASHDLQEPLRKIQAFGDRLKLKAGDTLDESCRIYIDRMQSSATRMRTLINDLLAYSRLTSQGQPFASVDLSELVEGVVSDLESRSEETGARIDVGPLPTLHADPTQMRQLFQNLIANALKFRRPTTTPYIKLRAIVASDLTSIAVPPPPTSGWRIIVSDNGIGFDPAYADRIFELFQRLHGRGEFDGTGIGLAVCRKIVERHGGRITAKGRPGEGAEFIIDLPDLTLPVGPATR